MDSLTQDDFVEETPKVCLVDGFDTSTEKGENVQAKMSPIIPTKFSAVIEKCKFKMESIVPCSPSVKAYSLVILSRNYYFCGFLGFMRLSLFVCPKLPFSPTS